jgi:hypothetical protein
VPQKKKKKKKRKGKGRVILAPMDCPGFFAKTEQGLRWRRKLH